MITGFNTDVEHNGVVYHVQTEDKGLESPLILSLIYSGGAILASKRSRYEDLIAAGYSDEAVAERLKRQHRLICAAIHAGRIDELKRMGSGQTGRLDASMAVASKPAVISSETSAEPDPEQTLPGGSSRATIGDAEAYTVHDPRRQSPLGEAPTASEGLRIHLLNDRDFRSGDSLKLRIMVSYMSGSEEKPMSGANVSLKVLGTTFRPQIYSMKTQPNGVATISAQIPEFYSGRAAILIRALANGVETEMRRVIHPS